jgi:beta-galactosidase/beta-glucuronidase
MPHVIRLRGPWRLEPITRTRRLTDGTSQTIVGPLPAPGEISAPSDWGALLGRDFRGRVRYTRRFNRPTGMADILRIDLVVECVDAFGRVLFNGQPLGEIPLGFMEFRREIKSRLEPFNRLEIEVELPECDETSMRMPRGSRAGLPGGLVGEVRLEITGR